MNITTSANWNRPVVGIVRVEREVFRRLTEIYGERLVPCVWDGVRFLEYDASEIAAGHVDNLNGYRNSNGSLMSEFPSAASLHGILPVRRPRGVATNPDNIASAVRKVVDCRGTREAQFAPGDVFITMGLDWDYNFLDGLFDIKRKTSVKVITCCYDLIPVKYPQYCVGDVSKVFLSYFLKLAWLSDHVVCISRSSQLDFEETCGYLGSKTPVTSVIRLGDNLPNNSGPISADVEDICREPFILFVSTIERRKNHEILYRAYNLLSAGGHRDKLPKLVFVGMPGWGVNDFLKDIELDPLTRGLIVSLNRVTDAELLMLYANAAFCLFPSLYEGWGLPVSEALSLGKVVIASDRGSLPEVGGDLVIYADPWNARNWANEILRLLDEPETLKRLSENVQRDYKVVDWDVTGEQLSSVVESLSQDSPAKKMLLPGYDLSTVEAIHWGSSIRTTGKPGLVTFGPHSPIRAGSYQVEIAGKVIEPSKGAIICSIVTDFGRNVIREHVTDLDVNGDGVLNLKFSFSISDDVNCYEVKIWVEGEIFISLDQVCIDKFVLETEVVRSQ